MSVDAAASNIDPEIALLHRLALDLRWSWNHASDELWRQIDPDLWARTHNPWVVLRTASQPAHGANAGQPAVSRKPAATHQRGAMKHRRRRHGFSRRTRIPA